MSDNTLANDNTGESTIETQAPSKTYTQLEVDAMMARTRGALEKKSSKTYEDLGDPTELRQLKAEAEQRRTEEALKRGEFEKIMQELAQKKDSEIAKRDSVIKEYKVNTPLLNAAAKHRSVNPDQVKALLAANVRLNNDGEVEVVDSKGTVRYTDAGTAFGVDELVQEFLNTNPHFVMPGSATTATKTNTGSGLSLNFDVSKLDMSNPGDRAKFKEAKAKGLI